MRPAGIYDWFTTLPPWNQQAPPSSSHLPENGTQFAPLQRQWSTTNSVTSASVGASTKRRSRAQAMWSLEGRNRGYSHSTLASSAANQRSSTYYDDCVEAHRIYALEDEDDLRETGDPWKDPWANVSRRAYAEKQDIHMTAFDPPSSPSSHSSYDRGGAGRTRMGLISSRAAYVGRDKRETDILLDLPPATTQCQAQRYLDERCNPYELPSPIGLRNSMDVASPSKPAEAYTPYPLSPRQPLFVGGGPNDDRTYSQFEWDLPHRHMDFTLFDRPRISKALPPLPTQSDHRLSRDSDSSQKKLDFSQNARNVLGWDRKSLPPFPEPVARRRGGDMYTRYEQGDGLADVDLADEGKEQDGPKPGRLAKLSGGRRCQWQLMAQILGLSLIFFNTFGLALSYGFWMLYYTTNSQQLWNVVANLAAISVIGSTQLCLLFALPLPISRLIKSKSHFRTISISGSGLLALGLFCTSWCHSLATVWVCQGLLVGVGMGIVFACAIHMAGAMYEACEERARILLHLAMLGVPLGGLFYTMVARALLQAAGFETTMRVLAGILLIILLPATFLFQPPQQESRGIAPHSHLGQRISSVKTPSLRHGDAPDVKIIGLLLISLVLVFPFYYLPSQISTAVHISPHDAAILLVHILLGNLFGTIVLGLFHHFRPQNSSDLPTLLSLIFMSTAIYLWAFCQTSYAAIVAVAWIYGVGSAGIWTKLFLLLLGKREVIEQSLSPTRPDNRNGKREMALACGVAGAMLGGMPICGAVVMTALPGDVPRAALAIVGVIFLMCAGGKGLEMCFKGCSRREESRGRRGG